MLARIAAGAALLAFAMALLSTAILAQPVPIAAREGLLKEVGGTHVSEPPSIRSGLVPPRIITADQIRQSTALDLPGVLRQVAGIDLFPWSGPSGAGLAAGLDGEGSFPSVTVLLNGAEVPVDRVGSAAWTRFPVRLSEIREIEVQEGQGAGGLVNILTFAPPADPLEQVATTVGTLKTADLGDAGTLTWGTSAGLHLAEPRSLGLARLEHEVELTTSADWQLGSGTRLGVDATHATATEHSASGSGIPGRPAQARTSLRSRLAAGTSLGFLQVEAYINGLQQHAADRADQRAEAIAVRHLFAPGPGHRLSVGGAFRSGLAEDGTGPVALTDHAATGTWDWTIGAGWTAASALRLDHVALDPVGPAAAQRTASRATLFGFDLALEWQAGNLDRWQLRIERRHQLLSPFHLDVAGSATAAASADADADADADAGARSAMTYELHHERRLPLVDAIWRAGLFYRTQQELHYLPGSFALHPDGAAVGIAAAGRPRMIGGEIGLVREAIEGWNFGAGYSLMRLDHRSDVAVGANFVATEWVHLVHAAFGFKAGRFESGLSARYVTPFSQPRLQAKGTFRQALLDAYATISAKIGLQLTRDASVALVGTNIDHARQSTKAGRRVEHRALLTLKFALPAKRPPKLG